MTRDELRAFDPQFAALADMARANGCEIRVSHYAAHDGWELGKPDAEPANVAVLDWTHTSLLETAAILARGKRK